MTILNSVTLYSNFVPFLTGTLHWGLRTFEHLFRLGSMQDIPNKKSYRINKKTRDPFKKREKKIQDAFKAKGLRVGFPNPKGNTTLKCADLTLTDFLNKKFQNSNFT